MGLLNWFTKRVSQSAVPSSAPGPTARLRVELAHTARILPGRAKNNRPGTNTVVVSSDGRCAATGHADGLLHIWDVATGTLTRTIEGHQWGDVFVALSPDGSTAFSACKEGSICLWDLKTGALVRQFAAARQVMLSMAGLTSDLTLAATNKDHNSSDFRDAIVLWEVATGRCLREVQTGEYAPTTALSPAGNFAAAGTQTGQVLLWDLHRSDAREAFSAHPDAQPYGAAVCFSGDGKRLGTHVNGGGGSRVAEFDKSIKVWNVDTRTCVATLSGHTSSVTSLSLNTNGTVALSTALDKTVYVWDAISGSRVAELAGDVEAPAAGLSGAADWAVVGSFIDDRLRFWKLTWS